MMVWRKRKMISNVANDDKNLMTEMIVRLLIEKDIFLRLRMSYILSNMVQGYIDKNEVENYHDKFKTELYDTDFVAKMNKRDIITNTSENNIAYYGKMKCDADFRYDEEVEKKVIMIDRNIDEFISKVLRVLVMQGSFNLGNR